MGACEAHLTITVPYARYTIGIASMSDFGWRERGSRIDSFTQV